ncbi:MAG TPA: 1-(5-phosphoribosyl)-5-[(5-phosphoribosylamino)methylideneamino]imidazole-4-carboxamide isomerase [Candidatus Coprocola pullicola]|nr:1-(5-phosphoribosyl)-5-[(5-phosphoribosylamino)methylideneamino]imidazole-4-carboxamide isomerase [Candidatus Coprocola pullicola]
MQIYPAVDIKNGKCVRLKQGNFDAVTVYEQNPVIAAKKWIEKGATYLHIVDLDGAKEGISENEQIIAEIAKLSDVPVQTGGGVRSLKDIERKLQKGVSRVILGTVAVRQPELVKQAVEKFGSDKIVVGIDAKEGYVAIAGWEEISNVSALDLCLKMKEYGVKTIIYTDIAKDGMMSGINLEATKELIEKTGMHIIASGGISNMADLENVQKINAHGVIIGKALYQQTLDLEQVIKKFEG